MKKLFTLFLAALMLVSCLTACGSDASGALKVIDVPLTVEEYAFAIHKERLDLLEQFNNTLQEMREDGTLQRILDHYLHKDDGSQVQASQDGKKSIFGRIANEFHINFVTNDRYKFLLRGLGITL